MVPGNSRIDSETLYTNTVTGCLSKALESSPKGDKIYISISHWQPWTQKGHLPSLKEQSSDRQVVTAQQERSLILITLQPFQLYKLKCTNLKGEKLKDAEFFVDYSEIERKTGPGRCCIKLNCIVGLFASNPTTGRGPVSRRTSKWPKRKLISETE